MQDRVPATTNARIRTPGVRGCYHGNAAARSGYTARTVSPSRSRSPGRRRPAIKYISLAEPSGYGVAATRCVQALARAGYEVTWTPMIGGHPSPPYYRPFTGAAVGGHPLDPFCHRPLSYDVVIVHTVPEYFPYWVEAERGRAVIGHTVWETTAIPAHWASLLNAVDRLWVPTDWNRRVFVEGGVTVPIDVIPHIAEPPAGDEDDRPRGDDDEPFVFYTIGVWSHRKAIDLTVRAFCEAFTAADPVTLVVKTGPRDETATGWQRLFRRSTAQAVRRVTRDYARPPRIDLEVGVWRDAEIARLHHTGDCYVSLCRGEGWGLGAFDAVAHGRPVVMTAFGGQLDFLDRDLAYLVDATRVPVVHPVAPQSYSPDQTWAEPDLAQAARLLRAVFTHAGDARARGRALQARVLARFGAAAVSQRMVTALSTF